MKTILVVDRLPHCRKHITTLCKTLGYQVIEADNGLEARSQIQKYSPDLVITDIVFPLMNGYELCTWVKQHPLYKKIPIIICSQRGSEFDQYWGYKKGADAYIVKPLIEQDFLTTVQQFFLEQHSSSSFSSKKQSIAVCA